VKIALIGKDGQVGRALQRALAPHGNITPLGRDSVDLEKTQALRGVLRELAPAVIVNAAAYTAVDQAESEPERARRVNVDAVGVIAEEADRMNALLVHYSTDYVFDGAKMTPYAEDDPTAPLSAYGRSKLEGEKLLRQIHDRHLIFRTSWVYSTRGTNFLKTMLRLAAERETIRVVSDQVGAPTGADLIADVTSLALHRAIREPDLAGTYHLAAAGETSWCDYARHVLAHASANGAQLKVSAARVDPISTAEYPTRARRPKSSRLDIRKLETTFGVQMPQWQHEVERTVEALVRREAA
jgi:dTDP-4-dehydrorhamnose reductase